VDIEVAGDVAMRRFAAIVMVSNLAVAAQWRRGGVLETATDLAGVAKLKHCGATWPPRSRRGVLPCRSFNCDVTFIVLEEHRTWLKDNGYNTMPKRCFRCR
jgi:hypothetical protein